MSKMRSPFQLLFIMIYTIVNAIAGPWGGAAAGDAAQDYSYALGLLRKHTRAFPTEDLAERLALNLINRADAREKLTGILIQSLLRRHQWQAGSAQERQTRMKEAEELLRSFLEKGQGHPLYEEAMKQQKTGSLDRARVLIQAAREDSRCAPKLRREAAEIFRQEAKQLGIQAGALRAHIKAALSALQKDHPQKELHELSAGQAAPLIKAATAFLIADQEYLLLGAEWVEAYPDTDTEKKAVAGEMIRYCEEKAVADDLAPFVVAQAWYAFAKGRFHALVQDQEAAGEAWNAALSTDDSTLDQAAKEVLKGIQIAIYSDLVKMKMKQAESKPERYGQIVKAVTHLLQEAIVDPFFREFLQQDAGKHVLIQYAEALTRQPLEDNEELVRAFEKAAVKLQEMVGQGLPWANNALIAMSGLADRNEERKVGFELDRDQAFSAARGTFQRAQQQWLKLKKQADEDKSAGAKDQGLELTVRQLYEQAANRYQDVIRKTRRGDCPTTARLAVEPQASFELGECLLKTEAYLQSIIAFKGLLDQFSKERRDAWAGEPQVRIGGRVNQAHCVWKKAVEALDGEDGYLERARKNMIFALARNEAEGRGKSIPDDVRMLVAELQGKDPQYILARKVFLEAQALRAQLEEFVAKKETKSAGPTFLKVIERYREAANCYQGVKPDSSEVEIALYQAAACLALARTTLKAVEIPGVWTVEERSRQIGALSEEALDAYQAFMAQVERAHPESSKDDSGRHRRRLDALQAMIPILIDLKKWDLVLETGQGWRRLRKENPLAMREGSVATNAYYLFRGYSGRAKEVGYPRGIEDFDAAEQLLPEMAGREDYLRYARSVLLAGWDQMAEQAEKAEKAEKDGASPDAIRELCARAVRQQEAFMMAKAKPELDDYGRLLHWHEKMGKTREAADTADRMLKEFDPEGRNGRLPDERWPVLLSRMEKIIRIEGNLQRWERCKQDHRTLVDYLYDDAGARFDHDPRRSPPHDRYPMDLEKALAKIASIRKNYPEVATVCPRVERAEDTYEGQGFIDTIEGEVQFRRRILATRQLLAEVAIQTADRLEADQKGSPEAKHYRTVADGQLQILLDGSKVREWLFLSARLRMANEDYRGALDVLYEINNGETDTTETMYVRARKLMAECYFLMGRFGDAVVYPQRMLVAGPDWQKRHWPQMRDFLEKCYSEGGVPRPKKVLVVEQEIRYVPDSPYDKAFREADRIYRKAKADPETWGYLLQPAFIERHDFLKGARAHFETYSQYESRRLEALGDEAKSKALPEGFVERYELLKELVGVEETAWKAHQNFDQAIMTHGGLAHVPARVSDEKRKLWLEAKDLSQKWEQASGTRGNE